MHIYFVLFALLFVLERIYLKIAVRYNIVDTPNHRSAHTVSTIRGGGIIVVLSLILYVFFYKETTSYYYLLAGSCLVGVISFIDDLVMLSSKIRLLTHFIAFSLIFYSLNLFSDLTVLSLLFLVFVYVFSTGFLNIYNFMDGINGITFLNALASYSALLFINKYYITFTDSNLLATLILSVLVFGFFNFRKKAVCFAGDIGSITIGFSLIYFVLKLYLISNNPAVLLIFAVYLFDGGWTIVERIFRKENIFEAHKRHLYQLLANDLKISHLKISSIYFILQLIINTVLIFLLHNNIKDFFLPLLVFVISSIIYLYIKLMTIRQVK